jgi:hypothetical protein
VDVNRQQELHSIQNEIGTDFDSNYTAFLLAVGSNRFEFRFGDTIEELTFIQPLPEYRGLRAAYIRFNEKKQKRFLPIATDFSEHVYLLDLDEDRGVYLSTSQFERSIQPLAVSFSDFQRKLRPIQRSRCDIVEFSKTGDATSLRNLLADGFDLETKGRNGLTLIVEATKNDNRNLIRECIEQGASFSNALFVGVSCRRIEAVELLVKLGADIHQKDESGKSALGYVGGKKLPGIRGTRNRKMYEVLKALGCNERR